MGVFTGMGVSNIVIDGLKFVGTNATTVFVNGGTVGGAIRFNAQATPGSNITVENCAIDQFYNAISVINTSNFIAKQNTIRNFYLYGVVASECNQFGIDFNLIGPCAKLVPDIYFLSSYGIMASGSEGAGYPQQACSMSFNTIFDVPMWDGIMSHGVSGLRVIGNDIRNVRNGLDIGINDDAGIINDVQIIGNFMECTTTNSAGTNAALSAGIFFKGSTNITATNCVISDNIVNGWGNMGPVMYTPAGNLNASIVIEDASHTTIANNVISGIGTNVYAGSYTIGISAYRCKDSVVISGNQISGRPTWGVRLQSCIGSNWTLTGNSFLLTEPNTNSLGLYIIDSQIAGSFRGNQDNAAAHYAYGATGTNVCVITDQDHWMREFVIQDLNPIQWTRFGHNIFPYGSSLSYSNTIGDSLFYLWNTTNSLAGIGKLSDGTFRIQNGSADPIYFGINAQAGSIFGQGHMRLQGDNLYYGLTGAEFMVHTNGDTTIGGLISGMNGASLRKDGIALRLYPETVDDTSLIEFDKDALGTVRGYIGFTPDGSSNLTVNVNNGKLLASVTDDVIITNGTTLSTMAKISASSDYSGSGSQFLSDDGKYKSVATTPFKSSFSTNYTVTTNQSFYLLNGTNQVITLPSAASSSGRTYRFSMTNGYGSFVLTNSGDGATIRDGRSLSYTNIGINGVAYISDGSAWWLVNKGKTRMPVASWSLTNTITLATDTITNIPFTTLEFNDSQGIALRTKAGYTGATELAITNAGTYQIMYSIQIQGSNTVNSVISVWLRKDGSDVARTRTDTSTRDVNDYRCMTVAYFVEVPMGGAYYELCTASHAANPPIIYSIAANPTGYTAPMSPGIIVTINRVSDSFP